MTDRADEIAREIGEGTSFINEPADVATERSALAETIAAALRAYGDAKLEEAAHQLSTRGVRPPISTGQKNAILAAAVYLRSLKSKPESKP